MKGWLNMKEIVYDKEYIKPSRIVGNLYFVGVHCASTHIIDTGEGLILIDPGYRETLYLMINNLWTLGYKPTDIKYIIGTHAHFDHIDAVKPLVEMTGAKTFIGKDDLPLLKGDVYHYPINTFEPDVLLSDGDVVTLGNTSIRFVATPGHTDGTMSPFFDVEENRVAYRVGMFGGAGIGSMAKDFLKDNGLPGDCRGKYIRSVKRLMEEKVDVFIGNHVWNNNTEEKIEKIGKTERNPFVDPEEWQSFLNERLEEAREFFEKDPLI